MHSQSISKQQIRLPIQRHFHHHLTMLEYHVAHAKPARLLYDFLVQCKILNVNS